MVRKTIDTKWSSSLAYVVGIIATDGNLSSDGRHIEITSKDEDLIQAVRSILKLDNKIGRKARSNSIDKKYYRIQFGNVKFYEFLLNIGLTPAKSKTLQQIKVPEIFFLDFVRGCIDGDGNISVSKHPESKNLQLRIRLASASKKFVTWIKETIASQLDIKTGWIYESSKGMFILSYGKRDSVYLLNSIYRYNVPYLDRKYKIAKPFIHAQVA